MCITDLSTGGENIYPLEIESRLVAHPSKQITRAAVVGIKHIKYGEVVAAFLLPHSSPTTSSNSISTKSRPSDDNLRDWVRAVLGRHKAPAHIFWFGDEDVGMSEVPQTGSGKVKKHVLRSVGERLVKERTEKKRGSGEKDSGRIPENGRGGEGLELLFDFNGMEILRNDNRRERECKWDQRVAETLFEYVYDENML